jgi:hypothetical protein
LEVQATWINCESKINLRKGIAATCLAGRIPIWTDRARQYRSRYTHNMSIHGVDLCSVREQSHFAS